jgi:hypothetical protein
MLRDDLKAAGYEKIYEAKAGKVAKDHRVQLQLATGVMKAMLYRAVKARETAK